MTATQAKTDDRRMGRRDLMRRTAIGAGVAVGVGASAGSVTADDDDDDGSTWKTAAFVAASPPAAAATAAYGALMGDDDEEEEVADALDYQEHVNEFTRAKEDRLVLDETLASLERDVQLVGNKAREEAIFRIWEQGVDGGDEASAEAAAEDAIQDTYAVVEESLIKSWNIRANRAEMVRAAIDDRDVVNGGTELGSLTSLSSSGYLETNTITLVNGEPISYRGDNIDVDATNGHRAIPMDPFDEGWDYEDSVDDGEFHEILQILRPDPDNYDAIDEPPDLDVAAILLKPRDWHEIWMDLHDEYDNIMAEVDSMIDTYFSAAQDGEVDLSTMRGPAHLSNTAENAEDYEEAALALRAMGYKLAEQSCQLEVEFEGETLTLDARLARTMNDPNPLPVGEEIDPDINAGSIYAALNVEDEDGLRGETTELVEPFTIVDAGGASEVTFETRQLAESDNDLTAEEITEIFEENREADDEAREVVHEVAVGGGGISIPGLDGDVNLGIVAAAVAVGAYLLGR